MMGAKGDGGEALKGCNALIIEDKRNVILHGSNACKDAWVTTIKIGV
jgi:hypothetical protein